jgi:hypothetical protein
MPFSSNLYTRVWVWFILFEESLGTSYIFSHLQTMPIPEKNSPQMDRSHQYMKKPVGRDGFLIRVGRNIVIIPLGASAWSQAEADEQQEDGILITGSSE